jgi:O-succinylbenzoic acid--CoA ligase
MSLSIHRAAADAPDRIGLVADGRAWTYADLSRRAEDAWNALSDRGLRPVQDQPVALVAPAELATISTLHALIAAGVPVHLVHPRLSDAERAALIERVRPALVIDDELRTAIAPDDEPPATSPAPGHSGRSAAGAGLPDPPAESALAVVYTSGSTGAAKGVVLSRRAFVAAAEASAANLGWRSDDRWLLDLPVAHVGGLSVVTRCLLARRTVVLPEDGADPVARTRSAVERDGVTLMSLVPTQLRRLLDSRPAWDPPPSLRAILLGGAPAARRLLDEAADRGWPILTTYGLTECCSQVATQRPGTVNRGQLGAGPPLPGVEVRIAGGEIEVRTPALFSDYYPAEGAPPAASEGWFATGDRGRLDAEGNLHPLGRADDVIVSGGENVDPLEVEVALRSCAGVRDACVFGVPDREWGERVVAAVVLEPGRTLEAATLERALRDRLASYKLPRAFVAVESIPVNRTGKPDRRATAREHGPGLADRG